MNKKTQNAQINNGGVKTMAIKGESRISLRIIKRQ